jgi:hypothetical protein
MGGVCLVQFFSAEDFLNQLSNLNQNKMKKVIFTLSCFMVFMVSCQEISDKDIISLNSFEDMNKINKELIDFTSSNLSSFLSIGKNDEVWFDKHQLALASFNHLDGKFVDGSNLDFESLTAPFKKANISSSNEQNRVTNVDYGTFNSAQITIADQFINVLLAIEDLSQVGGVVRNFNIQVLNSNLTQEEKDELLLLSSAALNLGNFFMNGGTDIIYQEMVVVFGDPSNPSFGGRVQGCSVDTRTVWHGAVLGLTGGAIRGAFVGAAGGSVAPGVGTVSGALSGAVIGGAIGFVEGAIMGGIGSLLYTCFR